MVLLLRVCGASTKKTKRIVSTWSSNQVPLSLSLALSHSSLICLSDSKFLPTPWRKRKGRKARSQHLLTVFVTRESLSHPEERLLLVRASNGKNSKNKTKISTQVRGQQSWVKNWKFRFAQKMWCPFNSQSHACWILLRIIYRSLSGRKRREIIRDLIYKSFSQVFPLD